MDADAAAETPPELIEQAAELGLGMLGIPEELGGVMTERSSVTTVLAAEALAHGDMGIALATLAPGAVASAIGLWGDAGQQAAYLPPFAAEKAPVAALALLEPRPAFDPLAPSATARREGADWVISGVSCSCRARRAASSSSLPRGSRTGVPGCSCSRPGPTASQRARARDGAASREHRVGSRSRTCASRGIGAARRG